MHYFGIGFILAGLLGIGMGYKAKDGNVGYIMGGLFIIAGILIAIGVL